MKIAILGATSQIARDLIVSFSVEESKYLYLFARRPDEVTKWLVSVGLAGRYPADDFSQFARQEFEAVINFVGVGNPAQAAAMGNSIFDITLRFDQLVEGEPKRVAIIDRRKVGLIAQAVAFVSSILCALQAWAGNTHVWVLYALVALWNGAFAVSSRTGQSSVEQVLAAIRAAGLHIKDISTEDPDLEDVFVSLTYAAADA